VSDFELHGSETPPMANGELVFGEPWESRVFGMARALCEQGHYSWDEFRACLIHEIDEWESSHDDHDNYDYYVCFLGALEKLLREKSVYHDNELDELELTFRNRPHGHDH